MNYLDFDIEIFPDNTGQYTVAAKSDNGGEAREQVRFPSKLQMESRLKELENALLRSGARRRRVLTKEEQTIQNFGRELFGWLLPNELRSLYRTSLNDAFKQDCGLRIRLRLKEAPELAILPWEFLYDDNEGEYVCLSKDTSIVRYLDLPHPRPPLTVTEPLRILGMVASPKNLPELDVAREKERVNRAVAHLQEAGLVELEWLSGQTARDIQRAMRKKWHIFHFIGHGGFDTQRDEGFIALCDANGQAQNFMASKLAQLLANQRALRLVLLNACEGGTGSGQDIFSSSASILVRRGLPAVLAMQYEITDDAAIELASTFYEALAEGLPVDAAVTEARQSIGFIHERSIEWVTPVLYMRSPDGKLFNVQTAESTPTPKTPPPQQHVKPKPAPVPPSSQVDEEQFTAVYLAQLRKQLLQAFNENELIDLCFALNVEYEDMSGDNRASKARELVRYLDRRGRINELLLACEQERPYVNWREIKLRGAEELAAKTTPSHRLEETQLRRDKPKKQTLPEPERDTFVHKRSGLEFVYISAGDFIYSHKAGQKQQLLGGYKTVFKEGNLKEYRIKMPMTTVYEEGNLNLPEYWISKTPVTNVVYKRFIDANPKYDVPYQEEEWAKKYNWDQQKRIYQPDKADHPVVLVSWYDAIAFCKWAGLQLPTEEQWEKAARGTDGRKYPWGKAAPTDKLCNFKNNIGDTTAVGQYSPQGDSPYGCVDMSGNVWEWCLNKYKMPENTVVDQSGAARVLRGGSWRDYHDSLRAVHRNTPKPPGSRGRYIGFRVVVVRLPSQ